MVGFQLVAALLMGKLPFRTSELYVWTLWFPVIGLLTLATGLLTSPLLCVFCRKLPAHFAVMSAAVLGLMLPPLVGLLTGLIQENLGHRLLGRWNATEGWIWGLVSAIPSAVAAAVVALIQMRRVKGRVAQS